MGSDAETSTIAGHPVPADFRQPARRANSRRSSSQRHVVPRFQLAALGMLAILEGGGGILVCDMNCRLLGALRRVI